MNPIQFMKKWGDGIKNLPPQEHLKAQMVGQLGTVIGMILAGAVMLYRGMWYWMVAMFFFIWLQVLGYYKIKKQYEESAKIMEELDMVVLGGVKHETKQE